MSSFKTTTILSTIAAVMALAFGAATAREPRERGDESDVTQISNGTASIGIDRQKGGAITFLSWKNHPGNAINIHDPGRLIQQSYYAGDSIDRTQDGQHKRWSPWTWNPIQGGGVGSWSRVTKLDAKPDQIFCETIPKLWDMPDEEAAATMRQWTRFEQNMPNVVVVRCEFESRRDPGDRWGDAAKPRHQELPACYFTRSFGTVKSYLGDGTWRTEELTPGPPWGKSKPPRKAMACFDAMGQGVALYSPAGNYHWNFGSNGKGGSADPYAAPCIHLASLETVKLGTKSSLSYRYWLIVGSESEIATRLDALFRKYHDEKLTVTEVKD